MIDYKPFIHHAAELERAILGACLIEKLAFGRIYGLVTSETFYTTWHQQVFLAMRSMYDNSQPIDIYTLTEHLTKNGVDHIDNFQTLPYLCRLTNDVVGTGNLEYHCHLIREMWQRREILKLKYDKSTDGIDPRADISEINDRLKLITDTGIKKEWASMDELIFNLMQHQAEMAAGTRTFVTTGFQKADQLNGGFYNGQMIVVGARPSVGKSALMGQMALKMARSGKSVGIISLEMNNNEIAARLSSIETDIPFSTIFRTIASDEDLHRSFYDRISRSTVNLPIYISDKTKVNVSEIKAKAIKLKATRGLDVLMIDYLQLLDTTTANKQYNREQEVAKMSRGLKMLAQELDIPVVVLCQLNRQSTLRGKADRYPKLSDLRESGAIEQDADVVLFIHRDWMAGHEADQDGNSTEFTADLLAPKWRNGATFHLPLDFDPPKMKFTERSTWNPVQIKPVENYYEPKDKDENPF